MTVTAEPRREDWTNQSALYRSVSVCECVEEKEVCFQVRVGQHASMCWCVRACAVCWIWLVVCVSVDRRFEGEGEGWQLFYVPLGGDHFKAVGSMDFVWPRLVSLAFQSSMRSCLFSTRCFPFQYLSIWRDCRVLTMSTGFTAVSWLISVRPGKGKGRKWGGADRADFFFCYRKRLT